MIKKVGLAISLIWSNFKLVLIKMLYMRSLRYSSIVWVSKNVTIEISKKGSIILGKRVQIQPNCALSANGGKIELIGNNYINRNTIIASHEHIKIGKGTTVGPNCCFYDHDHADNEEGFVTAPIVIGDNVWIGAGVTILKGVHIGNNSIIAAGSIVTNNVLDNTILIQKRESKYIVRKD